MDKIKANMIYVSNNTGKDSINFCLNSDKNGVSMPKEHFVKNLKIRNAVLKDSHICCDMLKRIFLTRGENQQIK